MIADGEELLAPLPAGHPHAPGCLGFGRLSPSMPAPVPRVVDQAVARSLATRSALGQRTSRGPAELLEQPDHPGRLVELTAQHAVAGRGRVGVVQVVPALAEAQDRQRPEVARSCRGTLNGRSPIVWQIELIDQVTWCSRHDPHQRGPEERRQRARPRPA